MSFADLMAAVRRRRRVGERMGKRRDPQPRSDDGWDAALAPFGAAPLDNEQRQARRESRLIVRPPGAGAAAPEDALPAFDHGWGEIMREAARR